jgi:hypothetical protein
MSRVCWYIVTHNDCETLIGLGPSLWAGHLSLGHLVGASLVDKHNAGDTIQSRLDLSPLTGCIVSHSVSQGVVQSTP